MHDSSILLYSLSHDVITFPGERIYHGTPHDTVVILGWPFTSELQAVTEGGRLISGAKASPAAEVNKRLVGECMSSPLISSRAGIYKHTSPR